MTRTKPYGDRRHHLRGSGRVVSLTPGRSGATAVCGAPHGTTCRPSPCPFWQGRQVRLWTFLSRLPHPVFPDDEGGGGEEGAGHARGSQGS